MLQRRRLGLLPPAPGPGFDSQSHPQFRDADIDRIGFDAGIPQSAYGAPIGAGAPAPIGDVLTALLALLALAMPRNSDFSTRGFGFTTFQQLQIFGPNPKRSNLTIQNVGAGDLMILFANGPTDVQDYSAAASQAYLNNLQQSSLRLVAGGAYTPFIPPKNAITIFTLGAATTGVAIEGV